MLSSMGGFSRSQKCVLCFEGRRGIRKSESEIVERFLPAPSFCLLICSPRTESESDFCTPEKSAKGVCCSCWKAVHCLPVRRLKALSSMSATGS